MTEKVVWHGVKELAAKPGVPKLAPHDPHRSCARLCHAAGGELEHIQFLLATFRCRRRKGILDASNGCVELSTTGSALNRDDS